MTAVTITDVINDAANDIAAVSYGGTQSLFTQMNLWTNGMFGPSGIFPAADNPQKNPGQRPVSNWYVTHLQAINVIEGPGVGQSGVVGTSAVINAVERAAYAVKFAVINGYITAGQQTAVIALYNTVWE
jgi:hypothetical protein